MTGFIGLFVGIWSIWSGSLGTLPYWNPYGAIALPVAMAVILATLAWLARRSETRG